MVICAPTRHWFTKDGDGVRRNCNQEHGRTAPDADYLATTCIISHAERLAPSEILEMPAPWTNRRDVIGSEHDLHAGHIVKRHSRTYPAGAVLSERRHPVLSARAFCASA